MSGLNFGIIGTGKMADSMMPVFQLLDSVNATAVFSSSADRASSFAEIHNIPHAYSSLEKFLSDENLDAIYIANATAAHAETAIVALNAGKHVLCEKPFAITLEEGERVIAAARRSGKVFMEGLWTHFLPAYQKAYSLLSEQSVGVPLHLTTSFGYPATKTISPSLYSGNGGGVLLDRAVYPISFALKALGNIEHIDAQIIHEDGVDVHVTIQTRHEKGAVAQLGASFKAVMSNRIDVSCSKGLISIPAPALNSEQIHIEPFISPSVGSADGIKNKLITKLKSISFLRWLKAVIGNRGEYHPYGANPYLPQLRHFIQLIKSGKSESDIISHAFSLGVLDVVERVRVSARD